MRYPSLECYCKLCDYLFLKRDDRETWARIKKFLDALHSWDGSLENVSHCCFMIVLVVLVTHYMGLLLGGLGGLSHWIQL
jgi:hypothetical protein